MAIQHLVWLKQKEHTSDAEINILLSEIRNLERLDGVLSITAGTNFTNRSNGYTHGVVVSLKDRPALKSYLSSSEHQELGKTIRNLCELMALDYDDTVS